MPPKVWLITSATSPLGYCVALKALQDGDSVALGCRRNEAAADAAFSQQADYDDDDDDDDGDDDDDDDVGGGGYDGFDVDVDVDVEMTDDDGAGDAGGGGGGGTGWGDSDRGGSIVVGGGGGASADDADDDDDNNDDNDASSYTTHTTSASTAAATTSRAHGLLPQPQSQSQSQSQLQASRQQQRRQRQHQQQQQQQKQQKQNKPPRSIALHKHLTQCISLSRLHRAYPTRSIILELDTRSQSLCHSSLAQTLAAFNGRLDVLLVVSSPTTPMYVGCLEEIPLSSVLAQFESAVFGPMNMIRAGVGCLRKLKQRGLDDMGVGGGGGRGGGGGGGAGHVVVVTGTTGGMGTPVLGTKCAADHAVEGFCDALAYEVAPFGIRVSVVQTPLEVNVLTNPLTIFPENPAYTKDKSSPVSFMRNLISRIQPSITTMNTSSTLPTTQTSTLTQHEINPQSLPSLLPALAESIYIITSISGLADPPGRIVVGNENAEQVKERLKAVSEELEDYLEASMSVDVSPFESTAGGVGGGSSSASASVSGGGKVAPGNVVVTAPDTTPTVTSAGGGGGPVGGDVDVGDQKTA